MIEFRIEFRTIVSQCVAFREQDEGDGTYIKGNLWQCNIECVVFVC